MGGSRLHAQTADGKAANAARGMAAGAVSLLLRHMLYLSALVEKRGKSGGFPQ